MNRDDRVVGDLVGRGKDHVIQRERRTDDGMADVQRAGDGVDVRGLGQFENAVVERGRAGVSVRRAAAEFHRRAFDAQRARSADGAGDGDGAVGAVDEHDRRADIEIGSGAGVVLDVHCRRAAQEKFIARRGGEEVAVALDDDLVDAQLRNILDGILVHGRRREDEDDVRLADDGHAARGPVGRVGEVAVRPEAAPDVRAGACGADKQC